MRRMLSISPLLRVRRCISGPRPTYGKRDIYRPVIFHPAQYRTWSNTNAMMAKRYQSIQYTSKTPVSSAREGSVMCLFSSAQSDTPSSNHKLQTYDMPTSNHKHADIQHHKQYSVILKYRYWSCGWLYVIISSPSLPKTPKTKSQKPKQQKTQDQDQPKKKMTSLPRPA